MSPPVLFGMELHLTAYQTFDSESACEDTSRARRATYSSSGLRSVMDDLQMLLAERACHRLINEYCIRVDEVATGKVGELFADDGFIENDGRRTEGAALLDMPSGTQRGIAMRHVSSSAVVTVLDADRAEAISYFTAFVEPAGSTTYQRPFAVGHYRDTFRRTPGGWKFQSRIIHTDMKGAE
jgi:hypothetical protein